MLNRAQIEFWNGPGAAGWVRDQEARDAALAPYGDAALKAAHVRVGEQVIDVGCGCGATSLALADAVGPGGAVLGVDVAAPLLARAEVRAADRRQLCFVCADAADFAFAGTASLLFSRFGVMFFDDAATAFGNLRRALAPGGRLAFVCWRSLADNAWMAIPHAAVSAAVEAVRPPPRPEAPGPLSFADPVRVRAILEGAGFGGVCFSPFDHLMPLGNGTGVEAAALDAITLGPAARHLVDVDDAGRMRALAAVRVALAAHERAGVVELGAAAWVVTADAA